MKSFIVKMVLVVCLTLCCLFYLDIMYEQKTSDPIAEVNKFNFVPEGIQIANMGSSHGDAAFNWDSLTKERNFKCFNFALASQPYKYDYALLNMHQNDLAEGGIVFIPVSYFSFNSEAVSPEDIEAISVRYYRILSPQFNPDYSLYKDLVAIRFPILSAGDKIFELFKPPITFPSLSENRQNIVYAAEANMEEGMSGNTISDNEIQLASENTPAPDPAPVSPEEIYGAEKIQEFEAKGYARYQRHFENKTNYFQDDKKQELINIIQLCKSKKVTPVLITTPFTVYYNQYVSDQFLYDFYTTINEIAVTQGVSYYDYSHDERFETNLQYFGDADHLNPKGAIYFTNLLLEEIPELNTYLSSH